MAISILLAKLVFSSAVAAMPPLSIILDRTAELRPGPTQIVQTLEAAGSDLKIKETWTINSPFRFRLKSEVSVDGKNYVLFRDYNKSQSETHTAGQKQIAAVPTEFLEHFMLYKDRGDLQQYLADAGIATSEDLTQRYYKTAKRDGELVFDYFPHPSMVLSRALGVSNYLLYKGSLESGIDRGIWIEADQFLVRKIKFEQKVVVEFSRYVAVGKTAMLPWLKTYSFDDKLVTAKATNISVIKANALPALENSNFSEIPDNAKTNAFLDFYKRFR